MIALTLFLWASGLFGLAAIWFGFAQIVRLMFGPNPDNWDASIKAIIAAFALLSLGACYLLVRGAKVSGIHFSSSDSQPDPYQDLRADR